MEVRKMLEKCFSFINKNNIKTCNCLKQLECKESMECSFFKTREQAKRDFFNHKPYENINANIIKHFESL